ncbi:MAG: PD-(D/E)XK nuclease family protein [Pseudoramibacter sp.]
MLRLMLGRMDRSRPTLTQRIDREIAAELRAGGGPMILVVPEQFTLGAEQALIKEGHLDGLLGVDVLSLKRLAYRVFEEVGAPAGQMVDEHGRQMIMTRAILECQNTLEVYQKSAAQAGFQKKMAAFVDELKSAQFGTADLDAALDQLGTSRLLSRKIQDIKAVMTAYENLLGDERFDEADRAEQLVQAILRSEKIRHTSIYLDGFYTFSELDFKIVGALIQRARNVTMTLVTDDPEKARDGMIFGIAEQTRAKMIRMAQDVGEPFEIIGLQDDPKEDQKMDDVPEDLQALEAQCFAAVPEACGVAPKHIAICECSDLWSEAEEAAREIVGLVRDGGYRYQDIGILVGDIDQLGGPIRRALSFYEIPCFVDQPQSVIGQPLIDCLLSALETAARHFETRDVLAFGKSLFSPVGPEDMMDLENYVIVTGVNHSQWQKPFTREAADMPRTLSELDAVRAALTAPLIQLDEALKNAKTYREHLMAVTAFLDRLKVQDKLDASADQAVSDQDFEKASRDNQIWNVLMTVFEQIDTALSEEACSLDAFIQVLKNGLASYDIGVLPEDPDVIAITDPFRSRHLGKKVMLVIGANEGLLPQESVQFPILSERERREMSGVGLDLYQDKQYHQIQNQYTLYLQLASVSEKLSFYYGMKGEDGKPLRRARILYQILAVFPKLKVRSTLLFDPEKSWNWITGFEGTKNIAYSDAAGRTPRAAAVAKRFEAADALKKPARLTPGYFDLAPRLAQGLIGPELVLSATDARQYSACAWRYFIASELKPVPREPYEVTLPDIGNVMHQMIDAFFKNLKASGRKLDTLSAAERDAWVEAILDGILKQIHGAVFDSSAAFHYQGRKLRRMGRRTMAALAEHMQKGRFEVVDSEHHFKYRLDSGRLGKPVVIHGSIDRLDRMEKDGISYYKVIDYKTGLDAITPADIYYGLSPQLLAYLDAAVRYGLARREQAEAAAGFYFYISDPITDVSGKTGAQVLNELEKKFQMKGIFLDNQTVIDALDDEAEGASNIFMKGRAKSEYRYNGDGMKAVLWKNRRNYEDNAKGILSGKIAPNPYVRQHETACDRCRLSEICGFVKEMDPRIFRVLDDSMKQAELLERIEKEQQNEVDH